jgi:2-desacetyl-2-hydroxyethyl bacteriochlorophyllide A dehydrogenase
VKALRIVAPGQTELVEIPKPTPKPGEALVRVRVVGYCGSDLNTFRGLNPLAQYPRIPGHEVAGIVEATGQAALVIPYTQCGHCSACRRGRFNCCRRNQTLGVQRDGALTEYIVVAEDKLLSAPKLSLRELALVEPLTVGFHAVARGQVAADDSVLVFGCGAIGLGAIAAAAARGARVIAVDVDDGKLALARKCGATETIRWGASPPEAEADVVIEAVGLPETFRAAVEVAGFAGRVVYIGYAKQPVEYDTRPFVLKELDIRGSRNALPQDFREVIRWLEHGRFPVSDVITRTVPLEQAGEALRAWSENPAAVTKIQVAL